MAYQLLWVILIPKNSNDTILTHSWGDKWVHTFPKGISLKMNLIARLEFEFAYYDVAV